MTYDPGTLATYQYDAENRLISSAGTLGNATYVYDANGRRVNKTSGGPTTEYLYDAAGNVIADKQGANWVTLYVYFGGQLLAEYNNSTTYFVHKDHLGSTRLLTKMDQSTYDSIDYQPFGEQIAGDTGTSHKFTAKERDSEDGLDNFGERYYTSAMGRFMRPDPSSVDPGVVDVQNPQEWNMYSYVQNDPTTAVDPDGLDCVYAQNLSKDGTVTVERGNCTQEGGTYVNGTIDVNSLTYNSKTNELGFTFSNEEEQTGGAGTISLGPQQNQNNSNPDQLNPFAQGVFTQLNQMNILNNTLKIYGASALIGITGGAACYYLCPEAGITTLGLEGAGEAASATPGQAASISRTAAQAGERALRSYQKRLAEHLAKLNEIKGDPGSVQREINNFRGLIKAAEEWLSKNP